jgi:hypothetical protein
MRRTPECYPTSAYALSSASPWFAANVELVPFGIAAVDSEVYATYAVQHAAKHPAVPVWILAVLTLRC